MNSREIEQAVVDNQNLVRFAINRYFPSLRDDEDIFQVGWIGLWRACIGYDSSRSKFSTYAVRCIINEIRVELRNRAKLWGFGDIASLDEPVYFDKDGDEFWAGGYCEDAFTKKPPKTSRGRRKTGRAYRRKMRRKTIQKYRNGNGWIYGPHLCGHWEGNQFVFGSYVKHPQNASNKVFFKRVSNKKVRRSSGVPTKGNGYRKVFDYWWTID